MKNFDALSIPSLSNNLQTELRKIPDINASECQLLFKLFSKHRISFNMIKNLTPRFDSALENLKIPLYLRLHLYNYTHTTPTPPKTTFLGRMAQNCRKIDNILMTIIIAFFGLLEGGITLIAALAWNEFFKSQIERSESWTELEYAGITFAIFAVVIFLLELIKLLFLKEVKEVLTSNDRVPWNFFQKNK